MHRIIPLLFLLSCRGEFHGDQEDTETTASMDLGGGSSSTETGDGDGDGDSSSSETGDGDGDGDTESSTGDCEMGCPCNPQGLLDVCEPISGGCPQNLECHLKSISYAECRNFAGISDGNYLSECQANFEDDQTPCKTGNTCIAAAAFVEGACNSANCCTKLCLDDTDCDAPMWCHKIYHSVPGCFMWPGGQGGYCGI